MTETRTQQKQPTEEKSIWLKKEKNMETLKSRISPGCWVCRVRDWEILEVSRKKDLVDILKVEAWRQRENQKTTCLLAYFNTHGE